MATATKPKALHFTGNDEADALLAAEPLALLIGFALDQQVTVPTAFLGPLKLKQRLGSLAPAAIAGSDPAELERIFREKPRSTASRARWRSACRSSQPSSRRSTAAGRSVCGRDATDSAELRRRISSLPGFGEMKIKSLSAVLAKRFGVEVAQELGAEPSDARRRRLGAGARGVSGEEAGVQSQPPQAGLRMATMRAAGIERFGGEVRMLELAAPGSPAPDELVISVRAAGVANWDEFVRSGQWDIGRQPPMALGVAAAGVVESVGDNVVTLAPGDEVLTHPVPLRDQGAWAQRLVAAAAAVAPKPSGVPWEEAAAFPVPALTADQALAEAAPDPDGEWVLVHGAGGVTGGLIVQLAVARGATVVATAGPSSAARVGGYGAGLVLDYHDPKWPIRVREASPIDMALGPRSTRRPVAPHSPCRRSPIADDWRRSPVIPLRPNEASPSQTSTSERMVKRWPYSQQRSTKASSRSTSRQDCR